MVTNDILKANARNQLGNDIFGGNWIKLVGLFLIISLAISALSFTGVGLVLVYGAIAYALARICVNVVKYPNAEINYENALCGIKENFIESLLLYILQSLFIMLWSLLLYIPGIIKAYEYSMSFYIMQENEGKSWEKCLDESKRMMEGNKWQLFCLDLSFLGWYILGLLVFGIGCFFVVPYHQMARANFYMALKAEYVGDVIVQDYANEKEDEESEKENEVEEVIIVDEN